MRCRRAVFGWLGVCLVWLAAEDWAGAATPAGWVNFAPAPVLLDELPAGAREPVRRVLEHPTLRTQGPVEAFTCRPATFYWLLDHPDRAVQLWRLLGARCTSIEDRGPAGFGWTDGRGSDVRWSTVLSGPRQRVWYAEGLVRPGPLLPRVAFQAVAVLDHCEGQDGEGRPALKQQMHLVIHADNHAVALAARLLGASAPRMAEQYVAQMEMFFGALAWYVERHPEQGAVLLDKVGCPPELRPVAGARRP